MNLQDEIKALKQRITELESQVDEEQAFPKYKDFYWGVNAKGKVFCDTWEGFKFEKDMLSIGNVYQTENEAVLAVEKLKVEAELRKFSDSWDLELTQYSFSFDWECGELKVEYPDYNQYPNSYYFYSIDDLQQAIKTVGKGRIKKYLFGVEE